MIINIGSKADLLINYLTTKVGSEFPGGIYNDKPIIEPKSGMYLYITLENNSEKISSDNYGPYAKNALYNFVVVGNNKSMPTVELYEALDTMSNKIRTMETGAIDLSGFKIYSIEEGNQSGVLRNTKENPFLVAQYNIIYKYLY